MAMTLLKDLIGAASDLRDVSHNELAEEVVAQLRAYQQRMPTLIENALSTDPDVSILLCRPAARSFCGNLFFVVSSCLYFCCCLFWTRLSLTNIAVSLFLCRA
jgi:hypothetical protein